MTIIEHYRPIPVWCRMKVPEHYQSYPILSKLTSQYGLDVSITAARLGYRQVRDGWFDLVLAGQAYQQLAALRYLQSLNIEVVQLGSTPFFSTAQVDAAANQCSFTKAIRSGIESLLDDPLHQKKIVLSNDQDALRIEVQIPLLYRPKPLLSNLISRYGVTINILAALLQPEESQAGRFDLLISGEDASIQACLSDLEKQALIFYL